MGALWLYLIFISNSLCSFPEVGYFITEVYRWRNCIGNFDEIEAIPATSSCLSEYARSIKLKSFDGKYLNITSYGGSTTCSVQDEPSKDVSRLCNSECDGSGRRCSYKVLPKKGSWKISNYLDSKCKKKSALLPLDVTFNSTDTCQKTNEVSTALAIGWTKYLKRKNSEMVEINALIVQKFDGLSCPYSHVPKNFLFACDGDCFADETSNFFYTCKYDSSSKIKLNLLAMFIIAIVIVFS